MKIFPVDEDNDMEEITEASNNHGTVYMFGHGHFI